MLADEIEDVFGHAYNGMLFLLNAFMTLRYCRLSGTKMIGVMGLRRRDAALPAYFESLTKTACFYVIFVLMAEDT